MRRVARQAGFSLIEALVVLLVGGMALMLIFAIGGQSARTGFALGRRALAASDAEVARDEVRGLIDGLQLAPIGIDPARVRLLAPIGTERGFVANAILPRPGVCGESGPTARLQVAIQSRPEGDVVTCQAGAGPVVVVADLAPRRARFSYSANAAAWSDRWTAPTREFDSNTAPQEQAVFIRLASDDGLVDVIGRATSGPPWLYPRPPKTTP